MLLVLLLGDKISSAEWITGDCYNSVPITIIYFRSIEDMDSLVRAIKLVAGVLPVASIILKRQ